MRGCSVGSPACHDAQRMFDRTTCIAPASDVALSFFWVRVASETAETVSVLGSACRTLRVGIGSASGRWSMLVVRVCVCACTCAYATSPEVAQILSLHKIKAMSVCSQHASMHRELTHCVLFHSSSCSRRTARVELVHQASW
jgi:hypothetical protein